MPSARAARCMRANARPAMMRPAWGMVTPGNALYPSPALLAHLLRMPQAVDEYLLWAISEGGDPFGTAMPAFKGPLAHPGPDLADHHLHAGGLSAA